MILHLYLKPYLSEWLTAQYHDGVAVVLPHYLQYTLLEGYYKKSRSVVIAGSTRNPLNRTPNTCIYLPNRITFTHIRTKTTISEASRRTFEKEVEFAFWSEVFVKMMRAKMQRKVQMQVAIEFTTKYAIKSITEEALIKHYYRKRKKIAKIVA